MLKKTKKEKSSSKNLKEFDESTLESTSENPYFGDLKGYLDLRSRDRASAAMWRNIAFILSFIVILAVSGIIYVASLGKYVPMVFYTDTNGAMVFGGIANQKLVITEPMIANQLADYLISLRQLPIDDDLRNEYLRKVKMMTKPSLFDNTLVPQITERYKSNVGQSIKVKVTNVYPTNSGKTTWTVEWNELLNSRVLGSYKAAITMSMDSSITDPLILLVDPLGIVVTDINISQEIK